MDKFLTPKVIIPGTIAVFVGYLLSTNPKSATIPFIPHDSPTALFPPWAIFRPAVAINDFFKSAFDATTPPNVQVMNLGTAYWKSEITYALTKNGIIEEVGNESQSCNAVAQSLKLKEFAVCEYMKAGSLLGLFNKGKSEMYSLTPLSELLKKDSPGSLRDFTLMINEESTQAWRASSTDTIKSGKSGFLEAFGDEFFSWHERKPEKSAQFDGAMRNLSGGSAGALLLSTQFPQEGLICDIGGGTGTLASTILEHYPRLNGIVFDQPETIKRGNEFLESNGFKGRAKAIGGNFFKQFPEELASCDVFIMKFILHDWSDEQSIEILKNILQVAKSGSKVVLQEHVLDTAGQNMETSKAMMSINMLASCPFGATERNVSQYAKLFKEAGYVNKPELIITRDITSIVQMEV